MLQFSMEEREEEQNHEQQEENADDLDAKKKCPAGVESQQSTIDK